MLGKSLNPRLDLEVVTMSGLILGLGLEKVVLADLWLMHSAVFLICYAIVAKNALKSLIRQGGVLSPKLQEGPLKFCPDKER